MAPPPNGVDLKLFNIKDIVCLITVPDQKGIVVAYSQMKIGSLVVEWDNGISSIEKPSALKSFSELEGIYQEIIKKIAEATYLLEDINNLTSKTGKSLQSLARDGDVDISAFEKILEDNGLASGLAAPDDWDSSQKCW